MTQVASTVPDELLARYEQASQGQITYPLKGTLRKAVAALDDHYWEEVRRRSLEAAAADDSELRFSDESRLLIDTGLIDLRLVAGASPKLAEALATELASAGHRVYYLSGWLASRYRKWTLLHQLDRKDAPAPRVASEPETLYARLCEARIKIYELLRPLFQTLPGSSPEVVQLVASGRLDQEIERRTLQLRAGTDLAVAAQRDKYFAFRRSIFEQLRTHAGRSQLVQQLDNLDKLNDGIAHELASRDPKLLEKTSSGSASGLPQDERDRFLTSEIHLVRGLLRLGTTDAGIRRTHSVLLSAEERTLPKDVTAVLEMARDVDPKLPHDLTFLIAPYTGAGFFEWDRDTIIIPLLSMREKEESILGGLATYRLMVDKLQQDSRLFNAYAQVAKGIRAANPRDAFIRDYRQWTLKVGKGWRGALEGEVYEFFKRHIGPPPDSMVMPIELASLTQKENLELLKDCRKRVNTGEADWEDYYHLAIAYYHRANWQEAYDSLQNAARLKPDKGSLLYSLGVLAYKLEIPLWPKYFKACAALSANTIWQVYASEYLNER